MGCHTSIASIMRDHSGCRCFVEELSHMRKDVTEISDDKTQRINDKYVAYCFGKSCPTRQDLTKASWTVSHVLPQEVWTGLANYAGHVSLLHYFTNYRSTNEHLFGILSPGRTYKLLLFHTSDTVKIIKLRIEAWEEIHDTPENNKWNWRDLGKKKTWPQSTNVWVPSSVFAEFTLIFRYCSYLQLGVVATCKPLLCFAMFSFIPLAHWRWWVWHVMTPCILLVQWFQAILGYKNSVDPHLGNKLMGCFPEKASLGSIILSFLPWEKTIHSHGCGFQKTFRMFDPMGLGRPNIPKSIEYV